MITTYRPDGVIDVEHEAFVPAMARFAELTGEDVYGWRGYLAAHRKRRTHFRAAGATATDHGHPTAATANLTPQDCEACGKGEGLVAAADNALYAAKAAGRPDMSPVESIGIAS